MRFCALHTKGLNAIENLYAISHRGDAHFAESLLVEVEEDITADVMVCECLCMMCALAVGEPASNVLVVPLTNKVSVRGSRGGVEESILDRGVRPRERFELGLSCSGGDGERGRSGGGAVGRASIEEHGGFDSHHGLLEQLDKRKLLSV